MSVYFACDMSSGLDHLSYLRHLGQIGLCTVELQQLPVSWRMAQNGHATPWSGRSVKTHHLNNFSSSRSLDDPDQISSRSD